MKPKEKKCQESCECNSQVRAVKDEQKILNKEPAEKKLTDEVNKKDSEKKPDPTRFGDWEIGGRAIDF